jgi:hypothetical protein
MLRSVVIVLVLTTSFGAVAQTGAIPPFPSRSPSASPGSTNPSAPAPGSAMPQSTQSFGDRAIQCQHYAYTQGLPPGSVGSYTESCVNSR